VARSQLEALDWKPRLENLRGWERDWSLLPLEVAARTGSIAGRIAAAETFRKHGNIQESLSLYTKLTALPNIDERASAFIRHRMAALEIEARLLEGGWVDVLPVSQDDPNWVSLRGTHERPADGALEVKSRSDGHLLYSRVRVGSDFEVKGDFEVVDSSNKSFQAGIAIGLPDVGAYEWYGFLMKHNAVEAGIASFARGWTRQQVLQPVKLSDRNSFRLRFQSGTVNVSVNGKEVFRDVKPVRTISVAPDDFLIGIGAFNDMNETVIRYRNVQTRKLSPGEKAVN